MTHKKFWKWFEAENGNYICNRGRFDLLQVDESGSLIIAPTVKAIIKDEINETPELSLIVIETFWQRIMRLIRNLLIKIRRKSL